MYYPNDSVRINTGKKKTKTSLVNYLVMKKKNSSDTDTIHQGNLDRLDVAANLSGSSS